MKIKSESNFRVVVTPKGAGDFGYAQLSDELCHGSDDNIINYYRNACRDIAYNIRRHVDDISYVSIESDVKYVCSFCKSEWDESLDDTDSYFPKGSPLCCDKAITEWKNNQQK